MSPCGAGVTGIGVFLPQTVRRNDWWPDSVVSRWMERRASQVPPREPEQLPEGARRVFAAITELSGDPFRGGRERRVMDRGMTASEMEVLAAEEALHRSGVPRSEIGALLTYNQLPDFLIVPTSARVHHQLGLPSRCFTLGTEGACNSFLMQLHLADQMIRSGAVEHALLVQSSQVQHLIRQQDEHSAWFGDGATAVVVSRVPEGEGLLHQSHLTDGSLHRVLVGGTPGKRWYDGEPIHLYFDDHEASVRMLAQLPDMGKLVLNDCFQTTGLTPGDVDFYAAHQGTVWFRRVTQAYAGMERARYFDSYPWTTSLGAANIPFELAMAQREGLLRKGDLVAAHSGGSGIVVSGALMRWCVT